MNSDDDFSDDNQASFSDLQRTSRQDDCAIPETNLQVIYSNPEYRFKVGVISAFSNTYSEIKDKPALKSIFNLNNKNQICRHITQLLEENKHLPNVKYLNPVAYTFAFMCTQKSNFERIDRKTLDETEPIFTSFPDTKITRPDIIRYCKFIISNKHIFEE